jgi:hypothetical protein
VPVWTDAKISPPPGFDPRTVQLVASRYTDYAIPASEVRATKLKQCDMGRIRNEYVNLLGNLSVRKSRGRCRYRKGVDIKMHLRKKK